MLFLYLTDHPKAFLSNPAEKRLALHRHSLPGGPPDPTTGSDDMSPPGPPRAAEDELVAAQQTAETIRR